MISEDSPRPTPQPGDDPRRRRAIDHAAWLAEQLERGRAQATGLPTPLAWPEFAVQSVADNHLVCLMFDGTAAWGDPVNVAKDPELRKSSYHGLTIDGLSYSYTGTQARTVTKTLDATTKDQVIIPKYQVPAGAFPGSIITAAPIPTRVDSGGADLYCQWREITQRAFANVEEAS